jgi:hypothetical protein
MPEIRINFSLWNATSPEEKEKITQHLKQHKVLKNEDSIVGDKNVPEPPADKPIYGTTIGQFKTSDIFDDVLGDLKKPLCQAGCDATAAAAVAALTLTGPGLAAAIAAIYAGQQICRNSC